ncbi:MAG: hypothetical protein RLZZ436_787 [Planctomycetota bacterium]|jgi:hypothetical protein
MSGRIAAPETTSFPTFRLACEENSYFTLFSETLTVLLSLPFSNCMLCMQQVPR